MGESGEAVASCVAGAATNYLDFRCKAPTVSFRVAADSFAKCQHTRASLHVQACMRASKIVGEMKQACLPVGSCVCAHLYVCACMRAVVLGTIELCVSRFPLFVTKFRANHCSNRLLWSLDPHARNNM
eukprot:TRINITY_DN66007_c0_g1_i1.p1 TRINITY_DN66007_c0_g1~~TRINITY_DN66007_c0_g1_i1.p1  ORF type:complete len:128 (-),score=8.51 TRINITY_DN66007_c0_g1_i1:99-482(-)